MTKIFLAPIIWLKKIWFIRNLNINFSGNTIPRFEVSLDANENYIVIKFYFTNKKKLTTKVLKNDNENQMTFYTYIIHSVLETWSHRKINGFHYRNFIKNNILSFLDNYYERKILDIPLAVPPEITNS